MAGKVLVVANWKMNPATFKEAKKLLEATRKSLSKVKSVSLVVAPPAVYLLPLAKESRGNKVAFAAQNAYFEKSGAHTGEISMGQVKDAGASHCLIGHSEVRARGETNDDARKKVAAALAAKLTPILCVGESVRTSTGDHFHVVAEQLKTALADTTTSTISKVVIAYEPVWAIGGEETMSPTDMHTMAIFIRKTLFDMRGSAGQNAKILYGGSVNEENTHSMIKNGDVEGVLVGHVSVEQDRFSALLESLNT